jgi:acyl-CoA reductase-like NAD-dependent aldehyde dehydrogenase
VVLKPAEWASISTLRFAELLESTDLPAGVVNVVTGTGAEAGEALIRHPGVAKIAFTGSTRTGKHVHEVAGADLKRLTLELGGKSPAVICADADLEAAARGAAAGSVWVTTRGEMGTGQVPFGGFKHSGIGREGGLEALDAYTQSKTVWIAL